MILMSFNYCLILGWYFFNSFVYKEFVKFDIDMCDGVLYLK